MNKKVLIGVAAVVLIATAVVGLIFGLGSDSKGYERVIKEYYSAIEQVNGRKMFDLSFHSIEKNAFVAELKAEFVESFEDDVNYFWGSDIKTTHMIIDVEFDDAFNYFSYIPDRSQWIQRIGLKKLAMITVTYTISCNGDTDSDTDSFYVAQIKNRWYLVEDPFFIGD